MKLNFCYGVEFLSLIFDYSEVTHRDQREVLDILFPRLYIA